MRNWLFLAAAAAALLLNACASPPGVETKKSLVTQTSSNGLACTLAPDELRAKREGLIPGLLKRADEVTELQNGCRMRFATRPGLLDELTQAVEQERTCCSFLRFQITIEANDGPVFFDVTGPPGTRELLRSL